MSLGALAAYYSGQIPGETAAADRALQFAFSMLMIRQMTQAPDPRLSRAEMEARLRSELRLSAAELQRAQAVIDGWRIERTAVTLRADQGLGAAEVLARGSGT